MTMSERTSRGCCSQSQRAPRVAAHLLVGADDDPQEPRGGAPAGARQRHASGHLGGGLRLHVDRAASPQHAVDDLGSPGIAVPVVGIGEHGVDVREEREVRAVDGLAGVCVAGWAELGDQVGAAGLRLQQLHHESGLAQGAGEEGLRGLLLAGRVDGAHAHQLLQQRGGLGLQRCIAGWVGLRERHAVHATAPRCACPVVPRRRRAPTGPPYGQTAPGLA